MIRRNFIRYALATVAGVLLPWPRAKATTPELRAIHRWTRRGWTRVRMSDLRPGDRFKIEQLPHFWEASTLPGLNPNGVPEIQATGPFQRPDSERPGVNLVDDLHEGLASYGMQL